MIITCNSANVCNGLCCKKFTIPVGPEYFEGDNPRKFQDFKQIADMLIYLGKNPYHDHIHEYTCKHHDKKTLKCKIYEDRPKMCRDYPYGTTCGYGCGFNNKCEFKKV